MTRHKFINHFATSYPREMYYALRKIAGKKGLSLQDAVREAVKFYLENEGEFVSCENDSEQRRSNAEKRSRLYE